MFFSPISMIKTLRVHQWWLYKSTHCFNGGKGIPGVSFAPHSRILGFPKKGLLVRNELKEDPNIVTLVGLFLKEMTINIQDIHPGSLTWNLRFSTPGSLEFPNLETIIFRFHVKLWGCIVHIAPNDRISVNIKKNI